MAKAVWRHWPLGRLGNLPHDSPPARLSEKMSIELECAAEVSVWHILAAQVRITRVRTAVGRPFRPTHLDTFFRAD